MKKLFNLICITLLLMTGVVGSVQATINGNSNLCSGATGIYWVSTAGECVTQPVVFNVQVSYDGSFLTSFASGGSFNVQWPVNNSASIRTGQISVSYQVRQKDSNGNCTGNIGTNTKVLNVVVRPQATSPSTPTLTSRRIESQAEFTANSTGATSYEWSVNNGYIIGCSTCATVKVQPNNGSCSVTATARGVRSDCGFARSNPRSRSQSVPRPNITGPSLFDVAVNNSSSTLYVQGNPKGQHFTYRLSTSSSSNFDFANTSLRTYSTTQNRVALTCDATNPFNETLRINSTNACGASNTYYVTLACLVDGGGGPNPFGVAVPVFTEDVKQMNINELGENIEKIEVVNLKNEVISKIDTKNDQFKLKGDDLKSGLNVLRVYYKDGSVKTSKIYKQK